jgi:hypothetical protein
MTAGRYGSNSLGYVWDFVVIPIQTPVSNTLAFSVAPYPSACSNASSLAYSAYFNTLYELCPHNNILDLISNSSVSAAVALPFSNASYLFSATTDENKIWVASGNTSQIARFGQNTHSFTNLYNVGGIPSAISAMNVPYILTLNSSSIIKTAISLGLSVSSASSSSATTSLNAVLVYGIGAQPPVVGTLLSSVSSATTFGMPLWSFPVGSMNILEGVLTNLVANTSYWFDIALSLPSSSPSNLLQITLQGVSFQSNTQII